MSNTHINEEEALKEAREQGLVPHDVFVVTTKKGEKEFDNREDALAAVKGDEAKVQQRRTMVRVEEK